MVGAKVILMDIHRPQHRRCFDFLRQSIDFLKKSDDFIKDVSDFLKKSFGVCQIFFRKLLVLLTIAKWALPAETLGRN